MLFRPLVKEGLFPKRVPMFSVENRIVHILWTCYWSQVQVIAKRTLREFWLRHPAAETPLKLWYARVVRARWLRPSDVRTQFGATVDFVAGNRAIFDVGGNKCRLVVKIDYAVGLVLICFVGLHAAYDRIDARTV